MTQIRLMRAGDFPALAALWVAAWQATLPAIDVVARLPWLEQPLAALQARGVRVLCAVDAHDQPLGFATLDAVSGEMDQLAVTPAAFGGEVAAALLAAVKTGAPGRVVLSVNQDNPRAVRFYQREGFRVVGDGVNPGSGLAILQMQWP